MLDAQGAVYADLAEVLLLAGRAEEAAEALGQALARYERKERRHGRTDALAPNAAGGETLAALSV
jgi:hypothetical protein